MFHNFTNKISIVNNLNSLEDDVEEHSDYVQLGTEIPLTNSTTSVTDGMNEEEKSLRNIILCSILGTLGIILLISYIIHWYQVIQRVEKNHQDKTQESRPPAAKMLSIRTFESQGSDHATMYDERVGAQYISVPQQK